MELATFIQSSRVPDERGVSPITCGWIQKDGIARQIHVYLKSLPVEELLNEFFGAAIARKHGLATPNTYLVSCPCTDLPLLPGVPLGDGQKALFGSEDTNAVSLAVRAGKNAEKITALLRALQSTGSYGAIVALDEWLANVDRHIGNLLATGEGKIILIDHGRLFGGPSIRNHELAPAESYRNRFIEALRATLPKSKVAEVIEEVEAFCTSVPTTSFDDLLDQYGTPLQVAPSELAILKAFLTNRAPHTVRLVRQQMLAATA